MQKDRKSRLVVIFMPKPFWEWKHVLKALGFVAVIAKSITLLFHFLK